MATTSREQRPKGDSVRSSAEPELRLPGGFTRLTMTFAMMLLVALAAFTVGALTNDSRYALVVLGLSIPVVLVVVPRGATHKRSRVRASS